MYVNNKVKKNAIVLIFIMNIMNFKREMKLNKLFWNLYNNI